MSNHESPRSSATVPLALLGLGLLGQGLLSALSVGLAQAEFRRVPSQYSQIQLAIDYADPGDVILVAPGTYSGPGNINLDFHGKELVCRSEGGAAVTIIDAQQESGYRNGFQLSSGETRASVIQGFTIINGYNPYGGAISCFNASPTIRSCVIRDCVAFFGGGISFYESGGLIQDTLVEECSVIGLPVSDQGGGGIYMRNSSGRVEDSVVRGNRIDYISFPGSGIYMYGGGALLRCTVTGNAGGSGVFANLALVDHCTIAYNRGTELLIDFVCDITGSILSDICAGSLISLSPTAWATATCSMIDPDKIVTNGGTFTFLTPAIDSDPLFCQSPTCTSQPTTLGLFHVGPTSAARPENNECGDFLGANSGDTCVASGVDAAPAGLLLPNSIAPNPSRGETSLRFRLPEASSVRISLLDHSGRRLASLLQESREAGDQTWSGDLRAIPGLRLAPGVYLIEVAATGLRETARVVLLP